MTLRGAACLVLLLAGAAAQDPGEAPAPWRVTLVNGDHVQGYVRGVRGKTAYLQLAVAPDRALPVDLCLIARTEVPATGTRSGGAPRPQQILRLRDGSVLLGTFLGIDQGRVRFEVEAIGLLSVTGAEIETLLLTPDVVEAYYRALTPRPAPTELDEEQFEILWGRLSHRDANEAWQARRALVRAGPAAIPWLAERLAWQPDARAQIRRLVAALDAEDGVRRELAQRRLLELGPLALPVLREAAREAPSTEALRRARALVEAIDPGRDELAPEVLRVFRAIRVLEEMRTPEAQEVLRRLASGDPTAPTSREAQRCLDRIAMRGGQ